MAKLTIEQWAHVQATWSNDPREGFQWLMDELGLDVSRPVLSRRATNKGWEKAKSVSFDTAKKVTQKVTHSHKKGTQKSYASSQKNADFALDLDTNNATSIKIKRAVGRPTAYQSIYAEVANKLCAIFGATDAQLAEWFGVCEKTVNTWKGAHPEFLQSIWRGKTIADANVARCLYERATGYSHPDVHIVIWQGEAIITPFTRHYAPDVGAAKYWLHNRQPSSWRNKVDVEVSTPPRRQRLRNWIEFTRQACEKSRKKGRKCRHANSFSHKQTSTQTNSTNKKFPFLAPMSMAL